MIADRVLARLTQIPGALSLWCRFPHGQLSIRVRYGIFDRPHYAYGVYSAAVLAKQLGLDAISAVELGVAGGRGLLALERIAKIVGDDCGIQEICPIHLLRHTRVQPAAWNEQMYVHHDFEHPPYTKNVTPAGDRHTQLKLEK
jgi:hypothetical protein